MSKQKRVRKRDKGLLKLVLLLSDMPVKSQQRIVVTAAEQYALC